jgi:transcriptional regulator with XRE-family HTH domain
VTSSGYENSFGYGERLKNLRLRAGLTQRDLAEKVGLKRESTYISLVEREARIPSDAVIDRAIGLFKDLLGPDAADEGDSLRQEVAQAHRRQEARSREQFIQRRRARAQARNDVKPVLTAGRRTGVAPDQHQEHQAAAPERHETVAPEAEDSLDDETVRVVRYVARTDPEFGRFLLGLCYWHLNRSDPEASAKALEWLRDAASRKVPGLE